MQQGLSKSLILITIIFMDLLTGMEFDLFVPSFPEIQQQFSLSPFWVEALLSVNFIGYCLSLFFVGDLADRYGRKPIILLGVFAFIAGSIICLETNSYNVFLIGRFLQGVGIAAPSILSFLIVADMYPLKQQQFLLAMLNGSMNIAVAIAPVIGSYLTLYFHWQSNFIALLVLGIITFVMTFIFIPTYEVMGNNKLLSLNSYIPIFKSKPIMLIMASILCMFVPYWLFVGMSPLLYMKDLGVSLPHFGYYQGVLALVFAIGSVLLGLIIKKQGYDQKKILFIANNICIGSLIFIVLITILNSRNPFIITFAMVVFVIGQIIPSNILYPLSLSIMPHAKGKVSAIIQGGRLIVSSIVLQIAGYFYQGSFRNIGIMLSIFICVVIILLFFVMQNRQLMSPIQTNEEHT